MIAFYEEEGDDSDASENLGLSKDYQHNLPNLSDDEN